LTTGKKRVPRPAAAIKPFLIPTIGIILSLILKPLYLYDMIQIEGKSAHLKRRTQPWPWIRRRRQKQRRWPP